MKKAIGGGLAALLLVGAASADEVWKTVDGTEIVYERDIEAGQMAVLSFDNITLYIEGLGGVYTGRGTYSGVWFSDPQEGEAAEAEEGCSVSMVRPDSDNQASPYWGQLEITFIDQDFPSIWMGHFGQCFGPLEDQMIARPVLGDEQ